MNDINVNSLRFGNLPVSWVIDNEGDPLLRVEGFTGEGAHIATVYSSGQWYAFHDTTTSAEMLGSGRASSVVEARQAALDCLVKAGVLTIVNETPAAEAQKFVRVGAANGVLAILGVLGVGYTLGDCFFTADIPAAQADALAAMFRAFNIPATCYEVQP